MLENYFTLHGINPTVMQTMIDLNFPHRETIEEEKGKWLQEEIAIVEKFWYNILLLKMYDAHKAKFYANSVRSRIQKMYDVQLDIHNKRYHVKDNRWYLEKIALLKQLCNNSCLTRKNIRRHKFTNDKNYK